MPAMRTGITTGACAAAAAKAAWTAVITGAFADPVGIILPRGETPSVRRIAMSVRLARTTITSMATMLNAATATTNSRISGIVSEFFRWCGQTNTTMTIHSMAARTMLIT